MLKPGGSLIVTVNGAGAVLQFIYVTLFLVYAPKDIKVKMLKLVLLLDVIFLGVVIVLTLLVIPKDLRLTIVGVLCAVLTLGMYASPLAVMTTVIRTKSVEYMPFSLSFFLFLNAGDWIVYSVLVQDFFIGVPNAIGFVLGSAQLILYSIYRNYKLEPGKPEKVVDGDTLEKAKDDVEMRSHEEGDDEKAKTKRLGKGKSLPTKTISRSNSIKKVGRLEEERKQRLLRKRRETEGHKSFGTHFERDNLPCQQIQKNKKKKKIINNKKEENRQKKNMGFIHGQTLNLLLRFFLLILLISPSMSSSKPTAYEALETFNFPMGLLPKGVKDFTLDESTGKFSATWNETCSFSLEGSYQLRYSSTIKGHISENKLTNLEGVSVKLFFVWVNIVEVNRNGDDLEFSVGIASAGFPIENFEICPQCGCGLDCGDLKSYVASY
ncbi:Protein of unknown function DUF538 [Dillenia turbinata]|uniref:Bidirectional sugar transporter SWEET n=1 Tax=Dillenia turbinata TaxID=194707 RepID=A0AAN8UA09_9MAGN